MAAADRFDRYLQPGERRVLEFTYHWMFLARPVAWFTVALLLSAALLSVTDRAGAAWVITVVALVWTGLPLLTALENRHAVRLIVTESRVVHVSGWLARRYGMMPLSKITDLTIEEPLIGRLFGYGTLIAESPGQVQALNRMPFLPEPLVVWHTISDLLYTRAAEHEPARRPPDPDTEYPVSTGPEPTTPSDW